MRNQYTGVIAGVAGVLFLSALAAAQNNTSERCGTFSVEILSDGKGHRRRRAGAEARSDRD